MRYGAGVYEIVPGVYEGGRAVYRHQHIATDYSTSNYTAYLFYQQSRWIIGPSFVARIGSLITPQTTLSVPVGRVRVGIL